MLQESLFVAELQSSESSLEGGLGEVRVRGERVSVELVGEMTQCWVTY